MQPYSLRVVGLDPSLRNWGIATGQLTEHGLLVQGLQTICPVLPTGKQTRQNSLDLESAKQLYEAATLATRHAHAVFVEVPVGSQSSRAMASYGICVGVLGALRAAGIPFFEVTATEVKMAGPGKKTASKSEMIEWAMKVQPRADWPYHHGALSEAKAEHMADAIGSIYAGIKLSAFRQMLALSSAQPHLAWAA